MKHYMFMYEDNGPRTAMVTAADSLDAFNIFRASHPLVIISHVWVEFGQQ